MIEVGKFYAVRVATSFGAEYEAKIAIVQVVNIISRKYPTEVEGAT